MIITQEPHPHRLSSSTGLPTVLRMTGYGQALECSKAKRCVAQRLLR